MPRKEIGMDELKDITEKFLREHFFVDEGLFAARREENAKGNWRFGFSHYMIGNVEVAMLTGENDRYAEQLARVRHFTEANREACFIEFFSPSFMISTVVVLTTLYDNSDSTLHKSLRVRDKVVVDLHDYKFVGDVGSSRAYFTFAKLTK